MRIHDGAYGTLLARHLHGDETADDLCRRAPHLVVEAHRAYIEAGATAIQTNSFLAHLRGSDRRRRDLQIAALDCARDAAAGTTSQLFSTIGPAGTEPRDFWNLLETVLDGETPGVLVETVHARSIADAFLAAWRDVAAGVDVPVLLGCTISPSHSDDASRWVVELAADAPEEIEVGLNCCEGPIGLRPVLRALVEQRGAAWVAPSAGVPTTDRAGTTTWPLAAPDDWAAAVGELVDELPIMGVGGCCGTTPSSIAQFVRRP